MKSILCVVLLFAGMRVSAAVALDSSSHEFPGIENFRRVFPEASILGVDRKGDVITVRFRWDNQEMVAWFDGKGELVATSGLVDSRSLPFSVQMALHRDYDGFQVLQAREFYHQDKGLSYFLIVKKKEKALILRADPDGNLSVEKKLREPS